MLVISRKLNESITIEPIGGSAPDAKLSEVFREGGIEIQLLHIGGGRIKIGIEAPPGLRIWRGRQEATLDGAEHDPCQTEARRAS